MAPLVVLASELAHFVVHDELHQLQACLANALLQGGGDFFERQVQLVPARILRLACGIGERLVRGQSGIVSIATLLFRK